MATLNPSRIHRAIQARFGEPVILPAGTVQAVVDLAVHGVDLRARGTSAARLALMHQAPPVLWLQTADAAGLKEQDPVTVRGTNYLVVTLRPDGAGMTACELMRPGAEPGPHPEWRPWR